MTPKACVLSHSALARSSFHLGSENTDLDKCLAAKHSADRCKDPLFQNECPNCGHYLNSQRPVSATGVLKPRSRSQPASLAWRVCVQPMGLKDWKT